MSTICHVSPYDRHRVVQDREGSGPLLWQMFLRESEREKKQISMYHK